MSFNLNPPQWDPKINRPQAANNDGRGAGAGGGGYAGGSKWKEEKEKESSQESIFEDELSEKSSNADAIITNFFRLFFQKVLNFFKKKEN